MFKFRASKLTAKTKDGNLFDLSTYNILSFRKISTEKEAIAGLSSLSYKYIINYI